MTKPFKVPTKNNVTLKVKQPSNTTTTTPIAKKRKVHVSPKAVSTFNVPQIEEINDKVADSLVKTASELGAPNVKSKAKNAGK